MGKWAGVLSLVLVVGGCSPFAPRERVPQKLVILGFDGLDPTLTERWMKAGRLPNLARLAAQGGLHRLETVPSAESATAWASFATGMNAGRHNIYDFLVRDPVTYRPDVAMVAREPGRYWFNYLPVARDAVTSTRGGTSFWVTAGHAGIRSSILTVPVTFPPESVPNGELLSGLPLPDIRGTSGTFSYFASDLAPHDEGLTEFGGLLRRLTFTRDTATAELAGPPDPIARQQADAIRALTTRTDAETAALAALEARADVRLPIAITWNREARTANVAIGDESVHLQERQWSRWLTLEFRVNALVRIRGMAQVLLLNAGPALQVYVTPVHWHPADPPAPISSPASLAADLYERLGPYRTLGPEATWPLNEDRIDEDTFLDDMERAFDDRAATILSRIDARRWDLLVGVIEATDRVQHMMWRLIDPQHPRYDPGLAPRLGGSIDRFYRKADGLVGEVMSRLEPGTTLLVMSDHGFHPFRYAVHLNRWLIEKGYMTEAAPPDRPAALADLQGAGPFWEYVDWSRTRAYAMGFGQIYVNLQGREGAGVVAPGREYDEVVAALARDLRTLTDPRTGRTIVGRVDTRDDIYAGPFLGAAPDLQVGFEPGYRASWPTTVGGAPAAVIETSLRKWSGDHASMDYTRTAGVLISSVRPTSASIRLIDIAPTVLKYFGVTIPGEIDGRPLF